MTSILVLSGETSREVYENEDINADIIVSNISELTNYL
ncbi:hypothetical protein [Clostridium cavendishii]|nr:hypothetical protein [Clostridium cavendishii]